MFKKKHSLAKLAKDTYIFVVAIVTCITRGLSHKYTDQEKKHNIAKEQKQRRLPYNCKTHLICKTCL